MPKWNIEIYDLFLMRWSYFCIVEANSEDTALSQGWERVEALDLESKSTIRNMRTKQITVIVCPKCKTEGRNVQEKDSSIGGVFTVTGAGEGRVGLGCPKCKTEFAILDAELESGEDE